MRTCLNPIRADAIPVRFGAGGSRPDPGPPGHMRPGGRPVGNSGQVQTGSQVHTSGRLAGNFGQVPIARATTTAGLRLRNVHRRRVPAELWVVVGRRRGAATFQVCSLTLCGSCVMHTCLLAELQCFCLICPSQSPLYTKRKVETNRVIPKAQLLRQCVASARTCDARNRNFTLVTPWTDSGRPARPKFRTGSDRFSPGSHRFCPNLSRFGFRPNSARTCP